MASIRKFRGKFNVQIRHQGYPSISRTFANLTIAKRWASTTEADMERNLHVVIPDSTTIRELLDRYEEECVAKSFSGPGVGSLRPEKKGYRPEIGRGS